MDKPAAATLTAALDAWALSRPQRVAYTFLRDGEVEGGSLTYAELRHRALGVATRLASVGARGERAILLYPQGFEFVVAFFGCLYAGAIAVPASIPTRKRGVEVLRRIVADSGASQILSTAALLGQLREDVDFDSALDDLVWFNTETAVDAASPSWEHVVGPDDMALIQYTSGSTGTPRGVAVSHTNLATNQRQVERGFGYAESTIFVSWLPMFHDMGLGTVLQAVWLGGHCVLMSPQAFLQHPVRWLRAISNYRATTSGGPDFAYDLCTRRVGGEDRRGLSLASWRVAYNGSEPVRAATIERFSEAFRGTGFTREAFHPVYGLAEATLFVSGGPPEEAPVVQSFSASALEKGSAEPPTSRETGRPLVSCGGPCSGTSIAIVNPDTREACAPGRVGEIWIRGPSVALGYWAKEAETATTFLAGTADGTAPFLRTGDLGFVSDGHLFVTGRHKDLIIIRGRNHYPQDIEATASACHPALVPLGCAAFSVDGVEGELLVVVQEVARASLRSLDASDVIRAIRGAVSEGHALNTHAIVLVKPSALPRTSSGKIRHATCRQAFLDKSLPAVASWVAPATPAPDTDAAPDSQGRALSTRADLLIDWLRHHAADLIAAYAQDGSRTVPAPLLKDFARQGLLGMQVETAYGGVGLGHYDTTRVLEQLAAFDFALALFVGLNNHLGIQPLARYAGPSAKALLLPGLVHGEEMAAFAFQEPGGAPNGLAAEARPREQEEHWQLFGTKYLDGVQPGASVIHVFVRHEEPPGISAFVVSASAGGLRRVQDGLSIGVLGFTRDTVVLDATGVGRDNLLGSLGSGIDIAREAMTHARLAIAAACVGGMKRCAQLIARDGLAFDTNLDAKLTPNPVTLSRLGSLTARIDAVECLVHRTARAIDAGHAVPSEAFAACRILGPELLLRSIDDLTQLGIRGSVGETNRIMALYRDAGLLRHFDGSPEAVAERTGAAVMESDASLRLLVEEVFCAPDLVRWIGPILDGVRRRMATLNGPLARRAQRWGCTRAGELTTWLTLLAAVEGSLRAAPSAELERARDWARAQLEHAMSSVRLGTPSETATLDTSDIAATFAAYARTIGDLNPEGTIAGPSSSERGWWGQGQRRSDARASPSSDSELSVGESSARELRSWTISWLARRLQIPVSQVEASRSFADHGLDSVASVELAKALSDKLGRDLDETLLWNFATIDALVEHLVDPYGTKEQEAVAASEVAPTPRSAARDVESQLDDEIARLEEKLRSRS